MRKRNEIATKSKRKQKYGGQGSSCGMVRVWVCSNERGVYINEGENYCQNSRKAVRFLP